MSLHEGHRARMKERFHRDGLDSLDDHNVLELLLFYAIPRVDVNPLAHRLLNRFGSLPAVFDAPAVELMSVEGMTNNAATLIKMVPEYSRRYLLAKNKPGTVINRAEEAARFFAPLFVGLCEERIYGLFLDAGCKLIEWRELGKGDACGASLGPRKLIEAALNTGASSVILAHNHPGGMTTPSHADIESTERLQRALEAVNIVLADHLIFAGDTYGSVFTVARKR